MSPAAQNRDAALRFAVVTPELHRNRGTERATAEVVARLATEHRVCLFAHRWQPDIAPNICYHRVGVIQTPGLLNFPSFYLAATRAVRHAARLHGGFDVVYSPGPNCEQVQVCCAWFCQARQLELFRSGKHRPAAATMIDRLKLMHRWTYAAMASRIERRFYSLPALERVIAPSHLLARDLQHFYGMSPERASVAHAGVDTEQFNPRVRAELRSRARQELGVPDGQFTFVFLGNNWLIKGLQNVIRALAEVPAAHLVVVGVGYERADSWQKLSASLGVAGRVHYVPRRADVEYFYGAADALLAPSVYDTFALMPLEAMACGLPVIISRNMGVAEIVGSDDCLMVEQVDDPRELSLAMQRIVEDADLRARLAQNGPRLAARHSWDANYRAIADVLLQTARRGSAERVEPVLAAAR